MTQDTKDNITNENEQQILRSKQKTNKERLKEITDGIEQGIKEVFESDRYKNYLETMSRFHNYSLNNTMLIYMQKPDATLVAGFNKWKDKFERTVMQGQKGIKIIAPTPYKKKIEQEKIDPETKAVICDANGEPIMETKTVKIPMYKPVTVFDVSQTFGKELPKLAKTLHGNVKDYELLKEAIVASAPVPVEFKPLAENTDGFFSRSKQSIVIRDDMSEVQTVCALLHETAHSVLHNFEAEEKPKVEKTQELEAESVAYAVSKYFGIETDENSFGYLASWTKDKDVSQLRECLETINETASNLINSIEKKYRELTKDIAKETTVDSRTQAQEKNSPTEPEIQNIKMPDPTVTVKEMNEFGYTNTDMLPLSKDRAIELIEAGCEVFLLYDDDTEGLAMDKDDILLHYGYSGIEKEEWQRMSAVVGALDNSKDKEKQFLESSKPCYAIYMLKNIPENKDIQFEGSDVLEKLHIPVDKQNYDFVYMGNLVGKTGNTDEKLSLIFDELNVNKPLDYQNRSLSVSDIVAINTESNVSYYYVDRAGFRDLPEFGKDLLKTAEHSTEINPVTKDGVIKNMGKESLKTEAVAKSEKKPSVLGKLNALKAEIATNPTETKERSERSF